MIAVRTHVPAGLLLLSGAVLGPRVRLPFAIALSLYGVGLAAGVV